jgi:hypothetical protein
LSKGWLALRLAKISLIKLQGKSAHGNGRTSMNADTIIDTNILVYMYDVQIASETYWDA